MVLHNINNLIFKLKNKSNYLNNYINNKSIIYKIDVIVSFCIFIHSNKITKY